MGVIPCSGKNSEVSCIYCVLEPSRRVFETWVSSWAEDTPKSDSSSKCKAGSLFMSNPLMLCRSLRSMTHSRRM